MKPTPLIVALLIAPGVLAARDGLAAETGKAAAGTESLTIASWGGAYGKAQDIAFIKPFSTKTGMTVSLVNHKGDFDKLGRPDDTTPPAWDVVDLAAGTLDDACRDGLLETIDPAELTAADDTLAEDDFLPGAFHRCGVASVAWSAAIVFDREAYKKDKPATASDFFDRKKFPGKRALPFGPKYTLELALVADGVAPGDVYSTLETDAGVARAFDKLESIREDIVWWRRGHEPLKLLADGTVAQAVAFNGRIFHAVVRGNRPFGIIWDGQVYDLDMWAVPKGSPNKAAALEFIAFSLRADRLAEQTRWFPYGPMRKSAIARIGKHAEVDVEIGAFVPTVGAHFKRAVRLDAAWWTRNEESLMQRFKAWQVAFSTDQSGRDNEVIMESVVAPEPKKIKKKRKRRPRKRRR